MLSASQLEIVAYRMEESCEFLCESCARDATSETQVSLANIGRSAGRLETVCAYSLDEYRYSEAESQEEMYESEGYIVSEDYLPDVRCDGCDAELASEQGSVEEATPALLLDRASTRLGALCVRLTRPSSDGDVKVYAWDVREARAILADVEHAEELL